MPIYEYQCQSCKHEMEALRKISDEPLRECPECGELDLKKKVSAAAFRLKGSGWYETDFKTGDKKNIAGDKASTPGDTGKASDSSKTGESGKGGSSAKDSSSSTSSTTA